MCWVDRFCFFHAPQSCVCLYCFGGVAIAVGRDIFRADANALAEILSWMQSIVSFSPLQFTFLTFLIPYADGSVDPGDALLNGHLIATWAKICQAMGVEFEPYLPFVIPPLISAAKADVSIDGMFYFVRQGWCLTAARRRTAEGCRSGTRLGRVRPLRRHR